jgi:hypothetical protein
VFSSTCREDGWSLGGTKIRSPFGNLWHGFAISIQDALPSCAAWEPDQHFKKAVSPRFVPLYETVDKAIKSG